MLNRTSAHWNWPDCKAWNVQDALASESELTTTTTTTNGNMKQGGRMEAHRSAYIVAARKRFAHEQAIYTHTTLNWVNTWQACLGSCGSHTTIYSGTGGVSLAQIDCFFQHK
jgi:hypothetical protein